MTQEPFSGRGEGVGISLWKKKRNNWVKNQSIGRLWAITILKVK